MAPDTIELPRMVITATKIDITLDLMQQRIRLDYSPALGKYQITTLDAVVNINITRTLKLEPPPPPTRHPVKIKYLNHAKLSGVMIGVFEWTMSDGTFEYYQYPYDEPTNSIWYFDSSYPGNHWARMSLDSFDEWDKSGTLTLPSGWSSTLQNNGLPTWEP